MIRFCPAIDLRCFDRFFPTLLFCLFVLAATAPLVAATPEVTFEGNDEFDDEELLFQSGLPEDLSQIQPTRQDFLMRIARGNIEAWYQNKGFFDAVVDLTDTLITDEDKAFKRYTYVIREEKQYQFGTITLIVPGWSHQLVTREALTTNEQGSFDQEDIQDDLQLLRSRYWANGYLNVQVKYTASLNEDARQVDVEFNIDPGAQARMGELHIQTGRSGERNTKGLSKEDHLQELWTIPPGQVLDGNYFGEFRSKLYGTRLFSQVRLDDSLNSTTGNTDLYLNVLERVPGKSKLGFFWDPAYNGAGISGEIRHQNIGGRFHEGSLRGQLAQHKQETVLGYANPMLFGTRIRAIPTPIRLDSRILVNHEDLPKPSDPDVREEKYAAAQENDLSFGFSDNIRYRFSTDLRRTANITESTRLLKLKLENGLDFNFTDRLVDPNFGFVIKPSAGNGGEIGQFLGLDETGQRYWYAQIQNRAYLPVTKNLQLAFAYDYGLFFDKGIEEDARVFYQGGPRSVRGYTIRSIAPKREVAIPDSSGTETETGLTPNYHRFSQEIRLQLAGKGLSGFQVVQFLDIARVADKDPSFSTALESALGLGLRYRWQVLTIRLDYTLRKQFDEIWALEPFEWGRISFDLSQAI